MRDVFFVSAKRSPIGGYMGSLRGVRVQDLAAATMKAAVEEAGIDSGRLDMSIYSQSLQSSLPANIGRHAWTLAGLSEDPAGYTLNTLCAGALQTMISGFNKIVGDEYGGMLVGGADSYSMAQYYLFHPRYRLTPDNLCFHDPKTEVETKAQPQKKYGVLTAAELADGIAARRGFGRRELDVHVYRDRQKLLAARDAGKFAGAIVPVVVRSKKSEIAISGDDLPSWTDMADIEGLPLLRQGGYTTEAGIARWADGAASLVMLSAGRVSELGCRPLAVMAGFGIAAGNPLTPEKTTLRSITKALEMCQLKLEDIDFFEIHSPSAAYALAVENELGGVVADRINVDGSSLSYCHPGAATGGIMAVHLVRRLGGQKGRMGLINVAALGGQSLSIVVRGV